MSRAISHGYSDHQVINTVNNPVETHSGCPVVWTPCRAAVAPPIREARRDSAEKDGVEKAGVESDGVEKDGGRGLAPGNPGGAGAGPVGRVVPAGGSEAPRSSPIRDGLTIIVIHLLTGQPTEVIHKCGDQAGRRGWGPENRQLGRSDPGRHSELHACKLLTVWIACGQVRQASTIGRSSSRS